ncbi:hypothetical protein J6590_008492 [Homalodisca vitripennis]|nr:hypothetical protein J6590_008492 [Homalodisca vitripennis]
MVLLFDVEARHCCRRYSAVWGQFTLRRDSASALLGQSALRTFSLLASVNTITALGSVVFNHY